ncbi:MAG TPA: anti-sigma factor [Candidatus Baltobacteraceae bacterium]
MQHATTDQLIDYIHGALAPEEDAFVHTHIDTCGACREEYASEVSLTELLRTHAAAEEREMPSTIKAAIWQQIRDAAPSPAQRVIAWMRPAIALPIAAAIVLAAYFGLHTQPVSAAPMIDAAYLLQDHAAMNSTVPFGDRTGANPATLEGQSSASGDQTAVNVEPVAYTADANR